jgi:hypothetical protein
MDKGISERLDENTNEKNIRVPFWYFNRVCCFPLDAGLRLL